MIKAPPVWRSFVYNMNSRASHPGMNQKREKDLREGMRFFLARVVSVTYHVTTRLFARFLPVIKPT